jgi:hypothetical protein
MKFNKKHISDFFKAVFISLLFGACWLVAFDSFDLYAEKHLKAYRSDFFFDIALFFLSGLAGAFVFYIIMNLLERIYDRDIKL